MFKPQTTPAAQKEGGLRPLFTITVDDPKKVGDPIQAFTLYTVHTEVCLVQTRLPYRLS